MYHEARRTLVVAKSVAEAEVAAAEAEAEQLVEEIEREESRVAGAEGEAISADNSLNERRYTTDRQCRADDLRQPLGGLGSIDNPAKQAAKGGAGRRACGPVLEVVRLNHRRRADDTAFVDCVAVAVPIPGETLCR